MAVGALLQTSPAADVCLSKDARSVQSLCLWEICGDQLPTPLGQDASEVIGVPGALTLREGILDGDAC